MLDVCLLAVWVFSYAVLLRVFALLRMADSRAPVVKEKTSTSREVA